MALCLPFPHTIGFAVHGRNTIDEIYRGFFGGIRLFCRREDEKAPDEFVSKNRSGIAREDVGGCARVMEGFVFPQL